MHTHAHTHTCISAHKAHTSCQFTAQKASPTFQHRLRCFPLLVIILITVTSTAAHCFKAAPEHFATHPIWFLNRPFSPFPMPLQSLLRGRADECMFALCKLLSADWPSAFLQVCGCHVGMAMGWVLNCHWACIPRHTSYRQLKKMGPHTITCKYSL